MTSDAALTSPETAYAQHIQEVLSALQQRQQPPRLVMSPEDLEALEREMRQRTDPLGSFLVGHHLQQALDAAALQAEPEPRGKHGPKPRQNDGQVKVRGRTAPGDPVPVWGTY